MLKSPIRYNRHHLVASGPNASLEDMLRISLTALATVGISGPQSWCLTWRVAFLLSACSCAISAPE
jgi:hypothetical protein